MGPEEIVAGCRTLNRGGRTFDDNGRRPKGMTHVRPLHKHTCFKLFCVWRLALPPAHSLRGSLSLLLFATLDMTERGDDSPRDRDGFIVIHLKTAAKSKACCGFGATAPAGGYFLPCLDGEKGRGDL